MKHKTKEPSFIFTSDPLFELRILAANSGRFTYKLDPPQFRECRYREETSPTRKLNILA
jgi:hypothetical protein